MTDSPVAAAAPRRAVRRSAALLALLAAAAGCQEKLTAPADCPNLCPGGEPVVYDTVLTARPALDTSFTGYIARSAASAFLVSNGLQVSQDRGIIRFTARSDSITLQNTKQTYTVDSVTFAVTVAERDSLVKGLRLILYRLPATVDSTTTFAAVEAQLTDAALVDTVPVPDTLRQGAVQVVLRSDKVGRVAIPAGDDGVLALGIRVVANGNAPTGVRLASVESGAGATFTSYVTGTVSTTSSGTLGAGTAFDSYVSSGEPAGGPDLLAVGGAPSSRALVRFDLPAKLRDSVTIVRATLELVPVNPLYGAPNLGTVLEARGLLADLGAKSPLCVIGGRCGNLFLTSFAEKALTLGSSDTVRIEVPQLIRSWQGSNGGPPAFFLRLRPEGSSFVRPVFYSTRSGVGAPRLRITYVTSFAFETP